MEITDETLDQIAARFKAGVTVKDRTYRLSKYPSCFVGKEAVDFMINDGLTTTRDEAVQLGQCIMTELGIFEHVTRDHTFADEYLFYHFVDRGDVAKNQNTKKKFSWADYLAPTNSVINNLQPDLPFPDLESVPTTDAHVATSVWPLDEHNVELLNNVHPTNWVDPQAENNKYDLVVVGAGAAGLVSAAGAAGVGAKVALIEENLLGGDCLNVGCVPSKTLIHAASLAHSLKNTEHLADSGISINGTVQIDFPKIMERVRRIRSEISPNDSAERFTKLGVEVFLGRGKFVDSKSVVVNGKVLQFNKAVIATGGYPSLIPMPGLKELHHLNTNPGDEPRPYVVTNETFFNMTQQPKKLVVIGPGVIGMEMAQSMQRLGTQVTVLGRSGRVLPKEDEDHASIVQSQLEKDGVEFRLNVTEYVSVELTGNLVDGLPEMSFKIKEKGGDSVTELTADAILVATGRRPNVTGMDLDNAGVEYDVRQGILVNDKLQTTNPKIYSAGDCCSTAFKFTHAADFMARSVIRNALFFGKEKMSNLLIPYATYTEPEIASVGLYGKDCEAKGIKYVTFEKHFSDNDRAICDGDKVGMVRIRVEENSDKILGATIIGKNAGNMISEITLAMQSNVGLGSIATVIHPYPTYAEAIRQTGDLYNKTKLTPTAKSLLRGIIKVQRF
jgi:pyruvate/2-oxoglutarate dehydrogenase complex dihydrolipoamide dehydrogenase (E3) component